MPVSSCMEMYVSTVVPTLFIIIPHLIPVRLAAVTAIPALVPLIVRFAILITLFTMDRA